MKKEYWILAVLLALLFLRRRQGEASVRLLDTKGNVIPMVCSDTDGALVESSDKCNVRLWAPAMPAAAKGSGEWTTAQQFGRAVTS